jgi:hypothetical protein
MWLTVTTHLELYHSTKQLKLRQNVFVEFPEIKIRTLQQLHHRILLCHTRWRVLIVLGSHLLGQPFLYINLILNLHSKHKQKRMG